MGTLKFQNKVIHRAIMISINMDNIDINMDIKEDIININIDIIMDINTDKVSYPL